MKKIAVLIFILLCGEQIFAWNSDILKLSLWGRHKSVGIPFNIPQVTGIEAGLGANLKDVKGLQVNLLYGMAESMSGIQISAVSRSNNITGLQIGFRNISYQTLHGVQVGVFNRTVQAKGLQLGLINISDIMTGLQLGIINKGCSLSGLQIGLFNIIENGPIPSMIGLNGRF